MNIRVFMPILVVMFLLSKSVCTGAEKSPKTITGYAPGDHLSINRTLYTFDSFGPDDEVNSKDYLVESISEKSAGPYTRVSAVQISDTELAIFKVTAVVDICDAPKETPGEENPAHDKKLNECDSKAKGLNAKLPKYYGNKYNYFSSRVGDKNFDPKSKCVVASKSIHGMFLGCRAWKTPPANRLSIEFTYTSQNSEGVHTKIYEEENYSGIKKKAVGYTDEASDQIFFTWHNEILEKKYLIIGRKYYKEKKKKVAAEAAKSTDLFD